MFSKLFKPRWQNRDPRVRLEAIAALDLTSASDVAIIEQLAAGDQIASVRQAAIMRMSKLESLLRLLNDMPAAESFDADKTIATKQLIGQLKLQNISGAAMTQFARQYPALNLLTVFAQHCPQAETLRPWLLSLSAELQQSPLQILELARLSRNADAIQAAIDAINDVDSLQQLAKQAGQLDKRSNQLVRARLKALRDAQTAELAVRESQEKLVQRIEALARSAHHPLYASELQYLQQQWQQIEAPIDALQLRFTAAHNICTDVHQQALAAVTVSSAEASEQVATISEQAEAAAPAQVEPEQVASTESPESAEQKQRAAERAARQQQKQEQAITDIEKIIPALEQAIAERSLRSSTEHMKKLRQAVAALDSKHAHAYSGKIALWQAQLAELGQWQEYAVLPKLEQLCAAMEQLIAADLPVPEKAASIRQLQEQWRALKLPAASHAQELWTRFKQASDTAYAPCAVYFAREKEQRDFNLAQRVAICAALEEFNTQDWAKADWKAVEKVIATAKREFFQFHPIPRDDEKSIKARFDKALGAIVEQQAQEFQRNESAKKALVDSVKTLLGDIDNADSGNEALLQSSLSTAIARTQQMQKDWKAIKPGRRAPDQALWNEFQQLCNAVFAKRNAFNDQRRQHNEQRQQAQEEAHKAAQELCAQIEQLKEKPDSELKTSREQFQALQDQFNALGDIGDKHRVTINQRFYAACDSFKHHVAGFAARQQQRQHQELLTLAALCQQLEYTRDDAQIAELQQQWDSSSASAEQKALLNARYTQALAIARAEVVNNVDANAQQRRHICIELEIATGSDSPESDRSLRRELQLQALSKGLGQNTANKAEQVAKLQKQWLTLPAAAPEIQAQLQARFEQLLQKI